MRKWFINNILPIISLILSILAIVSSFRNDPYIIDIDSAIISIVVSIISIPTAIVIGWNIYTVIDVKKYMDKIEIRIKNIEKSNNKHNSYVEESLNKNVIRSEGYSLFLQGESYLANNNLFKAYRSYIFAINYFLLSGDIDKAISCTRKVELVIRIVMQKLSNEGIVRDWDFFEDTEYLLHIRDIQDYCDANKINITVEKYNDCINELLLKTDIIVTHGHPFILYDKYTMISKKGRAIYIILQKGADDNYKINDDIFFDYDEFDKKVKSKVNGKYDLFGVCELSATEKANEVISLIKDWNEYFYLKGCDL